jgi:hypothetical protein
VLGHAETLLATMRHLITNERVRLISCPREPPPGPSFMQFAESTIRGKIALIVKRREAGTVDLREQSQVTSASVPSRESREVLFSIR